MGKTDTRLKEELSEDLDELVHQLNSGENFIFHSAILYDKYSKYTHHEHYSSNSDEFISHEFILHGTGKLTNTSGTISRVAKHFGSTAPLHFFIKHHSEDNNCLLYTSPSPRDRSLSRMPSSA